MGWGGRVRLKGWEGLIDGVVGFAIKKGLVIIKVSISIFNGLDVGGYALLEHKVKGMKKDA